MVHERSVHQKRVGRKLSPARTRVNSVLREGDHRRRSVLGKLNRVVQGAQDGSVVEDPVAGTHYRLAWLIQRVGPPNSGRDVVAIDRVLLGTGWKQRVVCFIEGDDLEIVTEPQAQGGGAHLPFVLGEHFERVIV